jgi:hypothetical protein
MHILQYTFSFSVNLGHLICLYMLMEPGYVSGIAQDYGLDVWVFKSR